MFGVLICLHVDFCGVCIALAVALIYSLSLHAGFFGPGCMLGSLALAQGKKNVIFGHFL